VGIVFQCELFFKRKAWKKEGIGGGVRAILGLTDRKEKHDDG
jgi:hypothetical protein